MQRDWLLGFPPVLLAQDEPQRKQFVTPPRDDSFNETTQEWLFRAFDVEWTKDGRSVREADCRQVKPNGDQTFTITKNAHGFWGSPLLLKCDDGAFTVASAPVGAEFATAGQSAYTADTASLAGTVATDPQPGASPIPPPGVWRKTAEHKPPVGSEHLTRYTGHGCEKSPDVRPLVWSGEVWREGAVNIGSEALRDWLDTSGEFKVGDRVRIGVSEHGAPERLCGAIGRVVQKIDDDFGVRVDGESRAWWYRPNELEHA